MPRSPCPARASDPKTGRPLIALDLDAGAGVSDPALSPDGQRVVFVLNRQLAVRDLDARTIRYLPNSENASLPFFSPDGRAVAFFANRQLHRISLEDGSRATLCNAPNPIAGVWGEDGIIRATAFFGFTLVTVPAGGGTCTEVTVRGVENGATPRDTLVLLPGYKAMLTVRGGAKSGIYALLPSGAPKLLIAGGRFPRYLAASRHLLYFRSGVLYGVRFDPERLEPSGATIALSEGVQLAASDSPTIHFDIAGPSGTLVYSVEAPVNRIVSWLEPDGSQTPILRQPGHYNSPRLSPGQKQLALVNNVEGVDKILLYDFGARSLTRLIVRQSKDDSPVWSPDGETMVFRSVEALYSFDFATKNKIEIAPLAEPRAFSPMGTSSCFRFRPEWSAIFTLPKWKRPLPVCVTGHLSL